MYVDGSGDTHKIATEDMAASKADLLGRTYLKVLLKVSYSLRKYDFCQFTHTYKILM